MPNFKINERILWIKVSGLPLCAWGLMAYKKIASSFGKFLFFEKEESTALSLGRLCISTKSHQLISESVQVDIKNESFEEVDHVSESNDEQPIDDFEILQTKLNNMDEQAFDSELGTEGDKKDGENRYSINSLKKKLEEATNFNSTNSETKDNSSNLSRPPGFEFMKKSFSSSSNCSTAFARHRKNDIKGFSLLSELNQIIESSLGYDVRGCLVDLPIRWSLFYLDGIKQDKIKQWATTPTTLERNKQKPAALVELIQLRKGLMRDPYDFRNDHASSFLQEIEKIDKLLHGLGNSSSRLQGYVLLTFHHSHSLNCMDRETLERAGYLEEIKECRLGLWKLVKPGASDASTLEFSIKRGLRQGDLYLLSPESNIGYGVSPSMLLRKQWATRERQH
ncbi:hypothetical protein Tco_0005945 [Tanacetum coccineum]